MLLGLCLRGVYVTLFMEDRPMTSEQKIISAGFFFGMVFAYFIA
jgi:hypothetical protein